MMARRGVLGVRAGGVMALLSGCGLFGGNSYRFKMTVEVDTPEGLRSGSSVYEVKGIGTNDLITGDKGARSTLRGEAVPVDITNGQTLFALLRIAKGTSSDDNLAPMSMKAMDPDRQMAKMFEAIFVDAPASNADDAIFDYLTRWNEILWQVYPDYAPTGSGNLLGAAVGVDQAFIMQMLIPAFEARRWTFDPATGLGTGLDIWGVAHALSINEERSPRVVVAANDNQMSAWRAAAFRFAGWEMAA